MAMPPSLDIRPRIANATAGLFAHAEYPLSHSLDHPGDPGLFGPGSATWEVMGDVVMILDEELPGVILIGGALASIGVALVGGVRRT
ncbi:MAG: hypothetical protein R6W79_01125, partial [Acidimicrobiia bacterium]